MTRVWKRRLSAHATLVARLVPCAIGAVLVLVGILAVVGPFVDGGCGLACAPGQVFIGMLLLILPPLLWLSARRWVRVELVEDGLRLSSFTHSVRVPLADVLAVHAPTLLDPHASIVLARPTRYGTLVTFLPVDRTVPYVGAPPSEAVRSLEHLVAEARRPGAAPAATDR